MNVIKFIVQRKILIGLLLVLVVMLGSYSIFKLDKEMIPTVKMDGAYIEISAGQMSAIEVERLITTPIEQKIQGIDGVEGISSTTNIGSSVLQIIFDQGKGEELFKEVEAIVISMKSEVSGITNVVAEQYGGSPGYEFFMDVSGGDMDQMTKFAKNVIEPKLEELPEVRDVQLTGILEHELIIQLNHDQLQKYGLNPAQVIGDIQQANRESTLGELSSDKDSPSLRWNTKLTNIDDVKNIKIHTQTGSILLEEIANVSLQPLENSSYVWKNGTKDFILIQIGRTSDVSQIEMANAVREEIKKIRNENQLKGFELNEVVAQADYVEEAIDGIKSNILIGGVIAIIILLLFLRNLQATFIIGLSIPASVLLTFATIWLFDYSLNILTMIGLGLGIGMMVDSSIVILESIYKKKEQGLTKLDAVLVGTKEVASAVISSMLTTIVVFLPIGLIGGDMGQYMIMLSVVVAITLISSVIVAFTLIPSLAEKFMKLRKPNKVSKEGMFLKAYSKIISWVIMKKRRCVAVIMSFLIMLVGSGFLVSKIPMTIMPDMFNRYTELMVNTEPGLSVEDKEKLVQSINNKLQGIQDVKSNYVMENGGALYSIINMTTGDEIIKEQKVVNEEILKSLRSLQETEPVISVQTAMNAGRGLPVQVNIKGKDFNELQTISEDFIQKLQEIDGIVGISNSIQRTSEEQLIVLKPNAIEEAGLTEIQLKQFIEQSFLEIPFEFMSMNGEDIPINIKSGGKPGTKSELLDLNIPTINGEEKLSQFIELLTVSAPNNISHIDGERYISISADIEERDLGAVNRDVQKLIEDFNTPADYTVSLAGDLEQQQELMNDMIMIFAIALFLVYLVMAVQFNHLGHPLIVMSIIPITIIGVILGLFITQMELSIMSGMGIVMLIGIVLNNAILLIDRTNQLRKEGDSVEIALIEAGKNRIRPIFMTTLTTVGGMLPLALASGTSGNYQAPMATAIISGLMFATIITLVLIPAVYRLFTISQKSNRRKNKAQINAEVAAMKQ
ncbi:efflux RND transporter permease subunit [Ferdinandcohnia quinoae]|uniref:Efflux RND transporter permease subunit n=1 Tax=Fredinandcohnia quinoae TaxID=2918902 RepID=A0AAW5E3H7_9BACI|nr:efflux RND transporter permease subunit [Fredinandcohnia sp. SECRCQ15]